MPDPDGLLMGAQHQRPQIFRQRLDRFQGNIQRHALAMIAVIEKPFTLNALLTKVYKALHAVGIARAAASI